MGVLRAGQVWAPPLSNRLPECPDSDHKRFSRSGISLSQGHDLRGLRSAVQTVDPSGVPTPPNPEHLGPRAQVASCPSLSFPLLSFNMGRAAGKNPPTLVSPGFLSRSYFSAPDPPCSSTLSSVTAFPALVRFWLSAPKSPRHLRSL